jgi:hypothetical protein
VRFALAAGVLACVACARPAATPNASAPVAAKKQGALLLANPGSVPAMVVPGAPREIVRGRVRFRLDDGGATRLSEVASDPALVAVALPTWLGEGIALFGEDSVTVASPSGLRPIARARLVSPSIGAHELWARAQGAGGDWVRIDLAKGEASAVAPPIAAPIVLPASYAGRALTAGPEYGSPSFAVALVDLLGPVMTRDAGATWTAIEGTRAAFPFALPTRVTREKGAISIATEDRAVPVSQAGVLGSPIEVVKQAAPIPEVAAVRIEAAAPFGVRLDDGELLVADGPRFARVQTDPVRVTRVTRDDSLTRCELGPTPKGLALAACMRHEEGSPFGGRLAVGTVVDGGSGPRLVSERTFAPSTRSVMSPTGALVVAARCDGSPEGGSDLLTATSLCVRDRAGTWTDLALKGARTMVSPLADGGVIVARDTGSGIELVHWARSATPVATPARLQLFGGPKFTLFRVDEVEPGMLVVWRRNGNEISALHVRIGAALTVTYESPRTIVDPSVVVAAYGEHAMIAVSTKGAEGEPSHVSGSISNDGGRTWFTDAFPEGLRTLEPASSNIDCGPSGCRVFGWSRVGWELQIAAADHVVDVDAVPRMLPPKPAPKRSTVFTATCVRVAPRKTIDVDKAYGLPLAKSGSSALLGLPSPKPSPGQVLVVAPLAFGTVRGAVLSVGPASGSWGSNARSVVRFTSDLDPPGVVHESAPFAAPFADRISAGGSVSAFALAPGRIVVAALVEQRAEVYRVEAGVVPQKIDLGGTVTASRIVSARELGGTLLLTGGGQKPDSPIGKPYAPLYDPTPFAAIVDANGAHTAFLAPSGSVDDAHLAATIDPSHGTFGVSMLGALPSWTGGTVYVLPLAADAHPGAGFSSFPGAVSDIARPTAGCSPSTAGWDRVESSWKALSLTIDKEAPIVVQGSAAARTRASNAGVCLDRFTIVRADSIFQLDAGARRAIHYALDDGGQTAHRDELSCAFGWE